MSKSINDVQSRYFVEYVEYLVWIGKMMNIVYGVVAVSALAFYLPDRFFSHIDWLNPDGGRWLLFISCAIIISLFVVFILRSSGREKCWDYNKLRCKDFDDRNKISKLLVKLKYFSKPVDLKIYFYGTFLFIHTTVISYFYFSGADVNVSDFVPLLVLFFTFVNAVYTPSIDALTEFQKNGEIESSSSSTDTYNYKRFSLGVISFLGTLRSSLWIDAVFAGTIYSLFYMLSKYTFVDRGSVVDVVFVGVLFGLRSYLNNGMRENAQFYYKELLMKDMMNSNSMIFEGKGESGKDLVYRVKYTLPQKLFHTPIISLDNYEFKESVYFSKESASLFLCIIRSSNEFLDLRIVVKNCLVANNVKGLQLEDVIEEFKIVLDSTYHVEYEFLKKILINKSCV